MTTAVFRILAQLELWEVLRTWKGATAREDFYPVHERRERAEPEIRETRALTGQLVQMRSADLLLPQKAEVVEAKSIGANNDNVHTAGS